MKWNQMKRKTLILVGLALTTASCFSADHPKATITNGLVRTNVYLPNAKTGYYRGTRFDWSGVVSNLEYAGHNYYPEWFQHMDPKVRDFAYDGAAIVAGPCTAITGTPEEFVTNKKALGFDEAKAGGTFIKIGVGVLRKPDDAPYEVFRVYDIVDGGKWSIKRKTDSVEFRQELSDPATGYAYVYRKTVYLTKGKAQMVLDHSLRNTGSRIIESSVYDHNFLFLDRQPPSPDFEVTFPFSIQAERSLSNDFAELRNNRVVFLKTLAGEDRVQFGIEGYSNEAKDYDIRVENHKVGAGVRITGDRPLSREFLWSIRAPLSVEPFIDMKIAPSEEFTWRSLTTTTRCRRTAIRRGVSGESCAIAHQFLILAERPTFFQGQFWRSPSQCPSLPQPLQPAEA